MLDELPLDHDLGHLRAALGYIDRRGLAIDAGAHQGIWTREIMKNFKDVVAFEPTMSNFVKLPDVEKYPVALGAEDGTYAMSAGTENTGQYHMAVSGAVSHNVSVVPLDFYEFKPDFIKFDVEGYELFALQGAEVTITQNHPFIMVELNGLSKRYGHTDKDVVNWLENKGYKKQAQWNKDYLFY